MAQMRDPKEPGVLEKDVEAYFREQVKKKLGGKSFKFRSPQNRGVTDRVAVLPCGEIWFIELKKVGGKLSSLQALHRDELELLGANWSCLVGKGEVDAWILWRLNDNKPTAFQAAMAARPKGAR